MKNIILGRMVFYYVFFFLFFYLTLSSLNNHGGWNFLALLNALIATADLVRALKLSKVYVQIKKHQ